ncbi:L-threonylcarbamoyladenylate synthase [Aureicoccus marinus]|uniref:Threonylcarbamoyl-AMP synthase n=1 Tax=Aureicoccus marinus TaxID=754435 RepID=A0A2S7T666_9FLAO|nr:L-threonylcarbamoyladenylate synthase [Aureicoccus marinus]PQJ15413.1 threonylcarbamoyl-AMP synthase [Aureicoccus marinus]
MSIISDDIEQAAALLSEGKLVAIPTETVYGLAANIFDQEAVKSIFAVKQRPLFNPLIVHLHSLAQVDEIAAEFPEKARQLADHFWPGPLTLILKKKAVVPDLITAGKDTVALRIPNHPITQELLQALDFPIAAPSANPFNRISPTRAEHVEAYFGDQIPMVLEGGECQRGIESTIVGFEEGEVIVYRLGSLALEDIEKVVGKVSLRNKKEKAPNAPGMLSKHYSPKTEMVLVDDLAVALRNYPGSSIGVLQFRADSDLEGSIYQEVLSAKGSLKEAAANLYQSLHKLDSLELDIILAERFPEEGLGKTINDRLERAAK